MHGEQREKFFAMMRRFRHSDPVLWEQFGSFLREQELDANVIASESAAGPLRIYAIAERRYRGSTNPNLAAIAQEWGIGAAFEREGKTAIEDALRRLRNAGLAGGEQTYVQEIVANKLLELNSAPE